MKFLTLPRLKWYPGLMLVLLVACIAITSAQSETVGDDDGEVALVWFELQLELVRTTPGFSPPVASRVFGYTGVTLYETIVPGLPEYQSLVGQLNDLTELPQPEPDEAYHWQVAANSALAAITRKLFPTASEENQSAIDALYASMAAGFAESVDAAVMERSASYGQAVADAIFTWSMTDGGHEGYLSNFPADYAGPAGAGSWVSTPRTSGDPQPAMQPYWGNNRPFVLDSGSACMPDAPPEYSESPDSDFYIEAMEVYDTVRTLSDDQREIALFWADDPGQTATPPGHSISILTQVLRLEEASPAFAAQAYARMGMAVADAFIGCWHAKYEYNLVRPVTVIQQLIEPDWLPIVNTPPFPEYPSGHSVQTAAAAVVLAELFGDDYRFIDHTHDERGLSPRAYTSFSEMAAETAMSRLYAGIHYRSAIERGLDQGWCIGAQVNELQFHRTA